MKVNEVTSNRRFSCLLQIFFDGSVSVDFAGVVYDDEQRFVLFLAVTIDPSKNDFFLNLS